MTKEHIKQLLDEIEERQLSHDEAMTRAFEVCGVTSVRELGPTLYFRVSAACSGGCSFEPIQVPGDIEVTAGRSDREESTDADYNCPTCDKEVTFDPFVGMSITIYQCGACDTLYCTNCGGDRCPSCGSNRHQEVRWWTAAT